MLSTKQHVGPPSDCRSDTDATLVIVELKRDRTPRDVAGQIADEVIAQLSGLMRAHVKVTLEIDAEIPDGLHKHVVRLVTENSQTLKFETHGFEEE